jgi:hypothetical protein
MGDVLEARQRELLSAGHDASLLRWQSGCLLSVIAMVRGAAREAAQGGGGGGGPGFGGGGGAAAGAAAAAQMRARAVAAHLAEVRGGSGLRAWGLRWWESTCPTLSNS